MSAELRELIRRAVDQRAREEQAWWDEYDEQTNNNPDETED